MRKRLCLLLAVLGWSASALAQVPVASPPSTPPYIIKVYKVDIQVTPDGLETVTAHLEIQAANAAAAQQMGQQSIPYSETMADVDVPEAYTLKADGRKLPVAPSAIYTREPQSGAAPMFDDQRQKVIVFPDVSGGDTLVYTYILRDKQTYIPNSFFGDTMFSRLTAFGDVDYSVTAPKSLPLYVEAHEVDQKKEESAGAVTWHWHYSQLQPLLQDSSVLSAFDRSPRIFYSSFKNYDDFSHAFAALALPKLAVTEKVQAKADEITGGITGHSEQARKLYEWVSQNIRYVGIEFGSGAIIPHDAESVLANGYGDCKDHVVLFAALLKAKGMESQMVLINLGNNYNLPAVPVLGELNHAITWIPEFGIYADTTAGVAPFGVLPFSEYGKPVVHVVASGAAVHQMPVLPSGAASMTASTTAHLDAQGNVIGQTKLASTGPFSIELRQMGQMFQAQGSERTASAFLQENNTPGTANFIVSASPTDFEPGYSIDSSFSLGPFTQVTEGQRLAMPSKFELLGMTGNGLIGPESSNTKESDPTPCYSGDAVEDVSLSAPPGRHFQQAPLDASIKTTNLSFVSRWTLTDDTLSVHREVVTKFDTALCTGQVRADMASAMRKIRENFSLGFALALDSTVPAAGR